MMKRTALILKRAHEIILEDVNAESVLRSTMLGAPHAIPVVEDSPNSSTSLTVVDNMQLVKAQVSKEVPNKTFLYEKEDDEFSNLVVLQSVAQPFCNSAISLTNLLPVQIDVNQVDSNILENGILVEVQGSTEQSSQLEDENNIEKEIISEARAHHQYIQEEKISEDKTKEPQGRPKKGRKRKFPSQNRQTRKLRHIQNQTHFTQKGDVKEKKEFRQFLCKCDCMSKIGQEKAREEYEKFYKVESHDAQRALICAMVPECPVKRKRVKNSDKRSMTRQYNINNIIVCKKFFLQTFRISSGKVDLALKSKKRQEGVKDLRGIGGGKNKISKERFQAVYEHIDKFPKYKSHYAREQTNAMYLRSDTTLPIMYNLYKEEVKLPVSFSKYKNIFLTCFNLKRKPLKKDTCNTCDKLEVLKNTGNNEEQNIYRIQKENHITAAQEARNLLKFDRSQAAYNKDLEVICFDMEKTLPLPRIPTNVVFYKRQLWLYNLGVHTAKKNKGHCYVWLEGEAGRGAQEVGSCLFKHITEDPDVALCKHLILWSDSCGGQNRNIKMVLMLKAVLDAHSFLQKITLRFLTSGHSFLPNDTDFGDIECALKFQQRLYSPNDYINIMKSCRKKNPLIVHKMEKDFFVGTANLEKSIVNRKTDINNKKINWLKLKEVEVRKECPLSIFIKDDFKNDHQEVNLEKKRGRPSETRKLFNDMLQPLWPQGKPIPEKKLDDLKFLMHLIPKDAKQFYKNLVGDPNLEEDIHGFNNELDFEIQDE